jgi:hypothetical protein
MDAATSICAGGLCTHILSLLGLPWTVGLRGERKMQRVFTTADYQIRHGRFLILSTLDGDKCTEVAAEIVDGTDEANQLAVKLQGSGSHLKGKSCYFIHKGFIIVHSSNFHDCALILDAESHEAANEELTRFLTELNAY